MYDQPVNTNNYELFYMSKDKDGNIVYDDGMFVDTTGATLKGKSGEFEVFKYARTFREPYYSGDPLIYFNDKIYKGECETEEDDKCIEYRLIESINEGNVYYYMKEDSLYLKNSSLYKNYPVRWYENEWSYMDLIELGSGVPGSKKNMLYNSINNKLKNYIIKNKSKYYYITSGGVADSYLLKDETYEDYLGNIDTDMINSKNMNTFIGKEMLLGYYKKETASEDKIGFLNLINGNKSTDGTVSEDVDYMGYDMDDYKSDTLVSMVGCENYYPVIKIKYKDIYFDYDTNIYTNANCNQDNVGTSQCPVIIKLDEGIYSDGVNR